MDIQRSTEVAHFTEGNRYSISMDEAELLLSKYDVLAVDTETRGDIDNLFNLEIVMLQLGCDKEQFVFDTRKSEVKELLLRLHNRGTLFVGHNLKFDYKVMRTN